MKGALALFVIISFVIVIAALVIFFVIFPKIFASHMILSDRISKGYSVINQFYMIRDNTKELVPIMTTEVANELGLEGGCRDVKCKEWNETDPKIYELLTYYVEELGSKINLPATIGKKGELYLIHYPVIEVTDTYTDVVYPFTAVSYDKEGVAKIYAATDEPLSFHVWNRYPLLIKIGRMMVEKGTYPIYPYIGDGSVIQSNVGPSVKNKTVDYPIAQPLNLSSNIYLTKILIGVNSFSGNLTVEIRPDLYPGDVIAEKTLPIGFNSKEGEFLAVDFDDIYIPSGDYFLFLNATSVNLSLTRTGSLPLQYFNESTNSWEQLSSFYLQFKVYGNATSVSSETYTFANSSCPSNQINVTPNGIYLPVDKFFRYAYQCNINDSSGNILTIDQFIERYYKGIKLNYTMGMGEANLKIIDTLVQVPKPGEKGFMNMTLSFNVSINVSI